VRGILILTGALAAAVLVAGCFEGKADMVFNPDGTGKIVGDLLMPAIPPWIAARKDPQAAAAPDDDMREAVANLIKRSSGIDAWKDVTFERAADGRVHLRATAYFKDLAKVRVSPDDRTRLSFASDGTNTMSLVLSRAKLAAEPAKPGKTLAGDELARRLKQERERYQLAKSQIAPDVTPMKLALSFRVPGVVEEMRGLEQQADVLSVSIEGIRILQAADAVFSNNASLVPILQSGRLPTAKELVNQKVFGYKGEVWARLKAPYKPKFDYAKEMDEARKAFPAMMQRLGLDKPRTSTPPSPPAPAPGAPTPSGTTAAPGKTAGPAGSKDSGATQKPAAPAPTRNPPSVPIPSPDRIPTPIFPF
jgi:hypothetical protein